MAVPATLTAFTREEFIKAHSLLASKVATMMGRKLEENDWTSVYCEAKGIPCHGWSNLDIDVVHNGLGVEHKMLCVSSEKPIREFCGTSRMHPAATRSIRIPSIDGDATETAKNVLMQYSELIEQRSQKVIKKFPSYEPDMRIGWLLWQDSLREFLYFEERMVKPNPDDYYAEWVDSGGGSRKKSRNLWVYENTTKRKRYSITTTAGAKIQPYFDIPAPDDSNIYYFCVQGEEVEGNFIRIWVTSTTALLLKKVLGKLDPDTLSSIIMETTKEVSEIKGKSGTELLIEDYAQPILLTIEAYRELKEYFTGISDEHMMQLFVRYLSKRAVY